MIPDWKINRSGARVIGRSAEDGKGQIPFPVNSESRRAMAEPPQWRSQSHSVGNTPPLRGTVTENDCSEADAEICDNFSW